MTDISDELVEKALHAWKENYDDEALGDAAWEADRFAFRKVLGVVVPEIERPLRNEIERRIALLRRLQDERSIDKQRTEARVAERDQEIERLRADLEAAAMLESELRARIEWHEECAQLVGWLFPDAERKALLDTIYEGCDCDKCLAAYAAARAKLERGGCRS